MAVYLGCYIWREENNGQILCNLNSIEFISIPKMSSFNFTQRSCPLAYKIISRHKLLKIIEKHHSRIPNHTPPPHSREKKQRKIERRMDKRIHRNTYHLNLTRRIILNICILDIRKAVALEELRNKVYMQTWLSWSYLFQSPTLTPPPRPSPSQISFNDQNKKWWFN